MENVLVVSNLNAGRKLAIKYKKKLHKFLLKNCANFKFITIDELNSTDVKKFDTVLVLGGDGTVNRVVPYIINTEIALGIIPCGTANLLSYKLKIPQNLDKSIKMLQLGDTKKIDTIKVNDNFCALRFGLGWDSDIINKTPQTLKNKFGYFAYFIAGILFALRLKLKDYKINDEYIKASSVIVANASNMYRNLISVGKNTLLDDGLLDVFVLKTTNPFIFFIEIVKMFFNIYSNSTSALYFKTDALTVKNPWLNTHTDGEKKIFKGDIDIKVIPKSLKVIYLNKGK